MPSTTLTTSFGRSRRSCAIALGSSSADRHPAALAVAQVRQMLLGVRELCQHQSRVVGQRGAEKGRHDAAVGAVEQVGARQRLDLLQGLRHRRLCHVEALGGAHQVAFLHDRHHHAQMAQGQVCRQRFGARVVHGFLIFHVLIENSR